MPAATQKIIGADFELSNSLETAGVRDGRVDEASKRLLAEIGGFPLRERPTGTEIEYGRRFLTGGGSAYIDSTHLEINLPEHARAADHALYFHAGLRIARRAQVAASRKLPSGTRLNLIANNSDGHESWGSHFNLLLDRQAWRDIHHCLKPHAAGFFAAHLVTSVLYTGQGHVGASNGRPACHYQLSQRADWFERFYGQQTMHSRPLINLRAEHHADDDLARMHVIYFDLTLCPTACFLRAGTTQLVAAMIECGWTDPTLALDYAVAAAWQVSRDLELEQRQPLSARGRSFTALEIQQALADLAGEFVASGEAADAVPEAQRIVQVWQETLDLLRRGEREALARRCDNWLKLFLLERQRGRRNLSWQSADLKVLDLMFGSLDPDESLFWRMAAAGAVDDLPDDDQIERATLDPPTDTRAWLRGQLLARHGEHVAAMDWSYLDFHVPRGPQWWSVARLPMLDPREFGRDQCQPLLQRHAELDDLVEALAVPGPST